MSKHKLPISATVILLSFAIVLGGCKTQEQLPDISYDPGDLNRAQDIAEDFVINSPTYTYDGIEDSLVLISRCPICWAFIFEFDSAHPGYGDRSGQVLPEQVTHHSVQIYINASIKSGNDSDFEIVGAMMDLEWDMINQGLPN